MADNKALFEERKRRFYDTVTLKKTDRVPIIPFAEAFPIRYYGLRMKDALNDPGLLVDAYLRYHEEFQPDAGENPFPLFGIFTTLGKLGYQGLKWAGHGVSDDSAYQYQEWEIMPPELYDWMIYDPTDFMIRHIYPKIYAKMAPLATLPDIRRNYSYISAFSWVSYADPAFKELGRAIVEASEEAAKALAANAGYVEKLTEAGFPLVSGSLTQAPLDVIADFYRGIRGLLGDLRRRPEKVLAACDKLVPVLLEQGVNGCRATGIPVCFIPLHMMIDSFMSQEDFEKFFWPTLLEIIRGLVAERIHPYLLIEGVCDKRLPVMIRDAPPGMCVYSLENSDIFEAKKLARDKVCLRGNIPVTLLMTGTPDQVRAYCKRLIDEVAPGGGLIIDTGVNLCDAKAENVKAMFEFCREYGVYK